MYQTREVSDSISYRALTSFPSSDSNILTARTLLIGGEEVYNMVLLHPDDGSVEAWTGKENADKMTHDFADFEPR